MTQTKTNKPNCTFSAEVCRKDWRLIQAVVKRAAGKYGECSWLGIGQVPKSNKMMRIDRIVFPEQLNSQGASDIEDDALNALIASLGEDERILWWGHSHGNGSTFYSKKDDTTWDAWSGLGPPILLGTCHNTKGELYGRLHVNGLDIELGGNPFVFPSEESAEFEAEIEAAMLDMKPFPKPSVAPIGGIIGSRGGGVGGNHAGGGSLYPYMGNDHAYGSDMDWFDSPTEPRVATRLKAIKSGFLLRKRPNPGYVSKASCYALEYILKNLEGNRLSSVSVVSRLSVSLGFEKPLGFPWSDVATDKHSLLLPEEWIDDLHRFGEVYGFMDCFYKKSDRDQVALDIACLILSFQHKQARQIAHPWWETGLSPSRLDYEVMAEKLLAPHLSFPNEIGLKLTNGRTWFLDGNRPNLEAFLQSLVETYWPGETPIMSNQGKLIIPPVKQDFDRIFEENKKKLQATQ